MKSDSFVFSFWGALYSSFGRFKLLWQPSSPRTLSVLPRVGCIPWVHKFHILSSFWILKDHLVPVSNFSICSSYNFSMLMLNWCRWHNCNTECGKYRNLPTFSVVMVGRNIHGASFYYTSFLEFPFYTHFIKYCYWFPPLLSSLPYLITLCYHLKKYFKVVIFMLSVRQ